MSQQPSQQQIDQMQQQQWQREDINMAGSMAQQAISQRDDDEGYWEVIGDADIVRDDEDTVGEFLATETSDKFALGNITRKDWGHWQWQIENEFDLLKNEFKDPDSGLDDIDMATMYDDERPEATDEHLRRIRSAQQVKKLMSSLSINAQGLRSGTEIHAVARSERPEEETEDGIMSSVKKKLI